MIKDVLNIFLSCLYNARENNLWRYFLKRVTRELLFICHRRTICTRILPKTTISNRVSIETYSANICLTNKDYVCVCKLSAIINNKGNFSFCEKLRSSICHDAIIREIYMTWWTMTFLAWHVSQAYNVPNRWQIVRGWRASAISEIGSSWEDRSTIVRKCLLHLTLKRWILQLQREILFPDSCQEIRRGACT